jgi:hypothetical protein
MTSNFRYVLEPYKGMNTRFRCPACQKKEKTFTLYIDTETGLHIANDVGKCSRETNCGYHYTPKQYFTDNNIQSEFKKVTNKNYATLQKKVIKNTSYIDYSLFEASLDNYENNTFIEYLVSLFGIETTIELINKYLIGTSKYWDGATIFWQIDTENNIRTGKIMLYNPATGKRVKQPFNHIQWVHSITSKNDFSLQQCLFGEHLTTQNSKPIAIVESEKTAIIASVYLPQFNWLATGSLSNLNFEKLKKFENHPITLFPDLNGFEKWSKKAQEMSHLLKISVSELLERQTTEVEKKEGYDIADYLVQYPINDFLEIEPTKTTPEVVKEVAQIDVLDYSFTSKPRLPKSDWLVEISELETYFQNIENPPSKIKLNQCSTIIDLNKFVSSHIAILKANNGNITFLTFLERLRELKLVL